ncbi:MAG: Ig-like domain-containing protein [Bacteroidota bacterium]
MKLLYNRPTGKKIRLSQLLSLIFFTTLFAESCRQKQAGITIVWTGRQATAISMPMDFFDMKADSVLPYLQVRLHGNATAMLGSYKAAGDYILFSPIIPLMPGGSYEVLLKNKLVGEIKIPLADTGNAPYVINIFPSNDTVPENLLKIYLEFSAPMQEGQALQHVCLLNDQNDTVPGVFLDLQPELWDKERTTLTLWLDPGRIKRDLIPNQKMGNPLRLGKHYTLAVSKQWKDIYGMPLKQSYTRKFVAGARDSISPIPGKWVLKLAPANSTDPLQINFGEALDYYLAQETIIIKDEKGTAIAGKIRIINNGTGFAFQPKKPWQAGPYRLQISSMLEDLAGNNLNRLFERDMRSQTSGVEKDFFEKTFTIR